MNLYADTASLHQLVLDGVCADDDSIVQRSGAGGPQINISRTPHVEMVTTGDEGTDFPTNPTIDLDIDKDRTGGLVLLQCLGVVGSDRDVGSVDERRPDVDLLVALVCRRYGCTVRDLLVPVGGVDVEPVVVDADLVVRVPGRYGDLEIGGQEVGNGGVEGVNGNVLEDETGLGRLQNGPDDENRYQNDEKEDQQSGEDSLPNLSPLLSVVVAAVL